jgi:ABC-type glycerol-3-phosphate transport system substrate-binding protein
MKAWEQQAAWFNGKTFNGSKVYGWAAQAAKGFGNVHTWLSFAYSYGCEPLNAKFTKSQLSTTKCLNATKQWNKMMKLMPPGANDFTYDSVTQAAQQGTIATAIQWSWGAFATDIPDASKTVGKWSFTEIPGGDGAKGVSHLAEWVISVSKFSENQAEAKKFVAWLETKNNDVKQASLGGGDPVRISSYSNKTLTGEKLAGTDIDRFRRYSTVLKAMESARPRPFFPGEEAWETLLSTELSAISLGQKNVTQGSKAADSAINKFLKG